MLDKEMKGRGGHKLTPDERAAMQQDYTDGVEVVTIARNYGVVPHYVTDLARTRGWPRPTSRRISVNAYTA